MSNLSEILFGETAKKICSVPVCEIPIKCILDKSIFINILEVKNEPIDLTFLVAAGIQIFQNKMGLKGSKWSSLNAPGTETTPLSHPYLKLEEFPFSHHWPLG